MPVLSERVRVLFVAEAVTLAHAARPAVLAGSLDPRRYEVFLASADRYRSLLGELPFPVRPIYSISDTEFLHSLAHGRPLHDAETLRRYVEDDLAMLHEVQPDVVIGDLRQSLSVSARVAGIPFVTILNAYWSPYAHQQFTIPEVPATHILGVPVANAVFQVVRPLVMAAHCGPMNPVRREHGMPRTGYDLRRMYTDADYVLYADVPDMVPTFDLPATHRYLGPVLWSPTMAAPDWWEDVPSDRPAIYVTPGSSGAVRILPAVFEALAGEPVTLLAAAAGAEIPVPPANAFVAKYLDGMEAARRSQLVISNGGSPTSQQALCHGVPVLGIPSNMDQHLNMSYVERAGAGLLLRSEHATSANIRAAVRRLLSESSFRAAAGRLQQAFTAYAPGEILDDLLSRIPRRSA
jgi:UDP:flavonoid glycosyltransferase YjiC (YdhE family)